MQGRVHPYESATGCAAAPDARAGSPNVPTPQRRDECNPIRALSPQQRVRAVEEQRRRALPAPDANSVGVAAQPSRAALIAALRRQFRDAGQPGARGSALPIAAVTEGEAARLNRILRAAGVEIDVRGFTHTADPDAARHTFKKHGSAATEHPRGQIALRGDDWAQIPDIVGSPDAIRYLGLTKRGKHAIGYWKRFNGHHYYVEQVLTGRRRLTAVTMTKHPGPVPERALNGEVPGAAIASAESPQAANVRNEPGRENLGTRPYESNTSDAASSRGAQAQGAVGDAQTGRETADGARRAAAFSRAATEAGADTIPPAPGARDVGGPPGAGKAADADSTTLFSSPLDPAAVRRFIAQPAMAAVRSLRNALLSSGAIDVAAGAARSVDRTFRFFAHSNRAGMRALAARYADNADIRTMTDALASDPGTGRLVRETFQSAYEARAKSMTNRLATVIRDLDDGALGRMRDALATGRGRDEVSGRVRRLLDEQHDYLRKAGLDLGYVRGRYFPRVLDTDAVLVNRDAFLADAQSLYRRMGLDAANAREAAEEWFGRAAGLGGASRFADAPTGTAHTRGRALPPDADEMLRRWYVTDPRETLTRYFQNSSRNAEFVRRFGVNGKLADEAFDRMAKAGVEPKDIALLRHHFASATGTMKSTVSSQVQQAVQWTQTIGVISTLNRAFLSSLVEGLGIGVRTGNVAHGLDGFATTWAAIARTKGTAEARRAAELMGVVSDALTDQTLNAREGMLTPTRLQQRVLSGMFRATGLHQITEAQRVAATKIGQVWVRQLADEVAGGAATQASARRLLAELGIDGDDAKALSAWLKRNDGVPRTGDLLGDSREAGLYRTAIVRFVNESIQNPEAIDRPALASAPIGRLAYGITSFMFAFTRNVLMRTLKSGAEAAVGQGYTMADRARLAGPLVGFMLLGAAQYGVSQFRERVLNPRANAERDWLTRTVLDLDRTGVFGTVSPVVNAVTSARYDRSLNSMFVGPYADRILGNISALTLGLLPQGMGGPNSPRTNAAEHAAARALYAGVLAPAVTTAVSLMPGGALQVVAGVGSALTVASPGASRAFADAVAGPRPPRREAAARRRGY